MKKVIVGVVVFVLLAISAYAGFRLYDYYKWQEGQIKSLRQEAEKKPQVEYVPYPEYVPVTEYVPYQVPNPSVHCTTWGSGSTRYTDCY